MSNIQHLQNQLQQYMNLTGEETDEQVKELLLTSALSYYQLRNVTLESLELSMKKEG